MMLPPPAGWSVSAQLWRSLHWPGQLLQLCRSTTLQRSSQQQRPVPTHTSQKPWVSPNLMVHSCPSSPQTQDPQCGTHESHNPRRLSFEFALDTCCTWLLVFASSLRLLSCYVERVFIGLFTPCLGTWAATFANQHTALYLRWCCAISRPS